MSKYDEKIYMLAIHRDNLARAKTLEEYKEAHVAYVDMLIKNFEAEKLKETAVKEWLAATDIKDTIEKNKD